MSDCRPDRFKYWYWENGERKKSRRDGYDRRLGYEALLPDGISYVYCDRSKMIVATDTRRAERRKHKYDD